MDTTSLAMINELEKDTKRSREGEVDVFMIIDHINRRGQVSFHIPVRGCTNE